MQIPIYRMALKPLRLPGAQQIGGKLQQSYPCFEPGRLVKGKLPLSSLVGPPVGTQG